MGCNLRNCYNTTLEDIFRWLKANIPWDLILFLLDLGKCNNNQARSNALQNFNRFSVFAASHMMKVLQLKERNGDRYDMSDARLNYDNLLDVVEAYNKLQCEGYGVEIDDLIKKYNGDINGLIFPSGLSDLQKQAILKYLLDNNNYLYGTGSYDDDFRRDLIVTNINDNVENLDGDGSDFDSSNLDNLGDKDKGFFIDLFGNRASPLDNIPIDELLKLNTERRTFTCFEKEFKVENYINVWNKKSCINLLTPKRIQELKDIHYKLLTPIYNYYYGSTDDTSGCQMKIYYGLMDLKYAINTNHPAITKHLRGKAVDFYLVGVRDIDVYNDIKSGRIDIDFGMFMLTSSLHITLPYSYENYEFNRCLVRSTNDGSDVDIEFL